VLKLEVTPAGSAYLTYRGGEKIVGDRIRIGLEVLIDLNAAGDVVGIEIVDVAIAESVESARAFAEERGLPFPRKIDVPSA